MFFVVRPDLFAVLDFIFLNHCEFGIVKFFEPTIVCFNDRTKSYHKPLTSSCAKMNFFASFSDISKGSGK